MIICHCSRRMILLIELEEVPQREALMEGMLQRTIEFLARTGTAVSRNCSTSKNTSSRYLDSIVEDQSRPKSARKIGIGTENVALASLRKFQVCLQI